MAKSKIACVMLVAALLLGCIGQQVWAQSGIGVTPDATEEAHAAEKAAKKPMPRRFFADDSFWNQPLPKKAEIDERSAEWIKLIAQERSGNDHFWFNNTVWTVHVFEANHDTPLFNIEQVKVKEWDRKYVSHEYYGHGPGFGKGVPIPPNAVADSKYDAHIAIIDWDRNLAWGMWGFQKRADGTFESRGGMKYRLDGSGVFKPADFPVKNNESIHYYGPNRASGVPVIAGLIMYDEIKAGEIRHKLVCGIRHGAYQEYVFPAIWTDGIIEGGIPQGSVMQLNPELDLSKLNLLPGEIVVAKALQEYGMVVVDTAGGAAIYAEGLNKHPHKSWEGILGIGGKGLKAIKFEHYRVLKSPYPVQRKGDLVQYHRWKSVFPKTKPPSYVK